MANKSHIEWTEQTWNPVQVQNKNIMLSIGN